MHPHITQALQVATSCLALAASLAPPPHLPSPLLIINPRNPHEHSPRHTPQHPTHRHSIMATAAEEMVGERMWNYLAPSGDKKVRLGWGRYVMLKPSPRVIVCGGKRLRRTLHTWTRNYP